MGPHDCQFSLTGYSIWNNRQKSTIVTWIKGKKTLYSDLNSTLLTFKGWCKDIFPQTTHRHIFVLPLLHTQVSSKHPGPTFIKPDRLDPWIDAILLKCFVYECRSEWYTALQGTDTRTQNYTGFTLSVRLSLCPSLLTKWCPLCTFHNTS